MTKWPQRIDKYTILDSVVRRTEEYFRRKSRREAIVYWTGAFNGTEAQVKDCIFPDEMRENTGGLYARVDLQTAFRVGKLIHERNQFLLIQLHTHPYNAFHSIVDDQYPISHRVGFISIVIPYYGQVPLKDQRKWAVYEYEGLGKWRHLCRKEVGLRFAIHSEGSSA